ncbi:hypothetical protein H8L32_10350 [Undibacterium sp. CY18W]|uniref:ABC-2 type transport system permease protein n=1 Tax=Undibacterium hunanense TaxID=2762292 RepID=A0ABR6ZPY4_9BURK|nr:hypothetical protein [Undibacterium hunanense]MBC3917874.1 hypothetical protein [Undibacterium hunanense]
MKTIISIWKQPAYARINTGGLKVIYFLMVLIALLPAVLVLSFGGKVEGWMPVLRALGLGVVMALGMLLVGWFLLFIISVTMQYTPANARLVPQFKRHMQLAVAIPVLLLPALLSLTVHFNSKGHFFQTWMLGVFGLLVYVASIRSKWVIILLVLMSQLPMWLNAKMTLPDTGIWSQPVLMFLAGLGMTIAVLHWVFSIHGDQHFKKEQSFSVLQKAMSGEEVQMSQYSMNFTNPYNFLLRHCMRKVSRLPETVSQLMPFSMGSQVFWLTSFLSVLVMSIGMGIYFIFFLNHSAKFNGKDAWLAYFAAIVSFVMLPFIYTSVVRTAVYQRRVEQGLLCLAVNLPDVKRQTEVLAGFLLRQSLGLWLVTAVIVGLTVYFSPASPLLMGSVWIGCFCLLPLSVMTLKNYALMKSRYESALLLAFAMPLLLGLVLITLYVQFQQCPAWVICVSVAIVTAIVLRWRWNRLMQVSAVFPAGRAA